MGIRYFNLRRLGVMKVLFNIFALSALGAVIFLFWVGVFTVVSAVTPELSLWWRIATTAIFALLFFAAVFPFTTRDLENPLYDETRRTDRT